MSSRKNKVLFIFALTIITLNLFALTQISGFANNQSDNETTLPSIDEGITSGIDKPLVLTGNVSEIPNMNLWDISINVTRSVSLFDFGYFGVNDTYQIEKHDNLTMPIFRFAYPKIWSSNLIYMKARTMWYTEENQLNDTEVYPEYENEDFTFYAVDLVPALDNSSQYYTINVFSAIMRPYTLLEYIETPEPEVHYMRNGILFNFSLIPHLTKKIDNCQASFNKAENGGLIEKYVYPGNATTGSATFIYSPVQNARAYNFSEPYNPDSSDYPYRGRVGTWLGHTPPIEAINYKRQIILENWYYARIHEEITIQSFGVNPDEKIWDNLNPLSFITFALLEFHIFIDNAQNAKVSDHLGDLPPPHNKAAVAVLNRINIYLRVPLMGGDTKKLEIDYTLKLEEIIDFEKSEFILNTLGVPRCDFHIQNFELEIIFPQGARFQYVTFGNRALDYVEDKTGVFLNIGRRNTVSFNLANVTSFENLNLRAGYLMSDLAYFIQPLTLALIVFIACLAYIGVRVLRKDVIEKVIITPEEKPEIPIDLIQKFVEKYEEKTALQTRITTLDENRRKKKVKAKEYDKQRKILEAKMRELIRSLDTTKRSLKEKGRKYFDVIQKIEISEEKRTSVERSIQDLRVRYIREKQISKDAYIRILRDYQNQIEKFERDIDKEIINLRLLIEHEAEDG
ncbi:MAG: hypothetical protein E3J70_04315 [Candidatus Heimdallarchaeota archaeon]|nr:MAG: hypothetical protein E3J70_04315 [Candidatus Heimdallarchaeota archaeon]